jgi:hypothetical protein
MQKAEIPAWIKVVIVLILAVVLMEGVFIFQTNQDVKKLQSDFDKTTIVSDTLE